MYYGEREGNVVNKIENKKRGGGKNLQCALLHRCH